MRKRILRQCLDIAKKNNNPETLTEWGNYHHFSFLVQKNKILAWDTNKAATALGYYPLTSKAHSEPEAYFAGQAFLDRTKPFEMVNIRLSKRNEIRLAKPCEGCYTFLKKFGCRKVYFSVDNELPFASMTLIN